MNACQLLLSDVAVLPRTAGRDSYLAFLQSSFSAYVQGVRELDSHDWGSQALRSEADRIEALGGHLVDVHRAILHGRASKARNHMRRAMKVAKPQLDQLLSVPMDRDRLGYLYRYREARNGETFDRKDLFHIPMDLRHLVRSMRYSALGIPMLYLGATSFISWEETGRLDPERAWIAAFRLREGKSVRVLNLGYSPAYIARNWYPLLNSNGPISQLFLAHAILWPLVAACSFRKRIRDASFVEEYVIPQQLVAYMVETRAFAGIRYFSTNALAGQAPSTTGNFVFPASVDCDTDHCPRLVDLFELSPPIPFAMVERLGPPVNTGHPLQDKVAKEEAGLAPDPRDEVLEAVSGLRVPYGQTEFARVETLLKLHPFKPIG